MVVFNGQNRQVGRTFSRFKDVAYSGVFRADGKLLAAGGVDGVVQVCVCADSRMFKTLSVHCV